MKASDFDSIVKWAGANDKTIIRQVLNGLDFINDMRVIRNVSGHGMLLPKMTVNKGIRPLDLSVETPNAGNRNFSGRKLMVYPAMKIIKMIPEEFRATFADRGLDPKATEIPLAQFVWEGEFEKISSEINDSMYLSDYKGDAVDLDTADAHVVGDYRVFGPYRNIYKCISNAAAGETPETHPLKWEESNAVAISTGPGTIIANEIVLGNIVPIATGAFTDSNALTKTELMINSMTPEHRKLGGIVYMPCDIYRMYLNQERQEYPQAANPEFGDGKKYVYGTGKKWEIREASWMGTSNRVIATQKLNLAFGCNLESDQNQISNVVKTLHGYVAIVKWLQGFEICDLETLYVNDQA